MKMQTKTKTRTRLTATVAAAFLLLALPAAAHAAQAPKMPSLAAAPLVEGAGYQLPHGSQRVRVLQLRLRSLGEDPGPIDGRFGPLTRSAVVRFQQRHGLAPDGLVGPQTRAALVRPTRVLARGAGYASPRGSTQVRKLQRSLRLAGEHPGPIDGRFGPLTEAAVLRFQQGHGLAADGVVGEGTTAVLARQTPKPTRVARERNSARNRNPQSIPSTTTAPGDAIPARSSDSLLSTAAIINLAIGVALGAGLALALIGGQRESRQRRPVRHEASGLPKAPAERREQSSPEGPPVLGYASVPRDPAGDRRDELQAQLQAIVSECRRRGLVLVDVVREHEPERAKGLQRPGLGYALRRIANGEARGLVVAELSRISRSVTDVGEVLDWFSRAGARLIAARPRLDTGEQDGRLAARTLIEVSSSERERLGERTRKGLEAARREGRRRGRLAVADNPELSNRIARMRAEGMTLQHIADRLNEERIPTIRGGALWRPSSVQAVLGYRRPDKTRPNTTQARPENGHGANHDEDEGRTM
jgi:peptidoglycan hydrolase-like protein with peptidoglycan-binding domain/DNA invertase Pin-like site-specific DNA recombinase